MPEIPARLAAELAAELLPVDVICDRYQITADELAALQDTEEFRKLYAEAKARWHSDVNAEERIRSKSKMLVEDSLLEVYSIVHDPQAPRNTKLQGFKELATVADLGVRKAGDTSIGAKTTITINFPQLDAATPARSVQLSGDIIEQDESSERDD